MSHFFHGSIFPVNVKIKLLLQFFLFHINRIIYFIVFIKIAFLPRDDVNVDMWNCLASLRTILNSKCK
uniref:Uncharacterized protein n=1 Tax=Arundo donax TaxID=35708 RepID=A0A0A9CVN4_ARUDO